MINNKINIVLSFILLLLGGYECCCGQDTIMFVNGKKLITELKADSTDFLIVKFSDKGKNKIRAVMKDDVYYLAYPAGRKIYYYRQDSASGREYSVQQLGYYINGEIAARYYHQSITYVAGGFIIGGVGAFLSFWGIGIPAVYTGALSFTRPRIPAKVMNTPGVKENEFFIQGYRDEASRMRTRNVAESALAGLLLVWTYKVLSGGFK